MISAYAPQTGLSEEVKNVFWEELVAGVKDEEIIVLGSDLNGHVGRLSIGYEGIHGGWGTAPEMQMGREFWNLEKF